MLLARSRPLEVKLKAKQRRRKAELEEVNYDLD